MGTFYQRSNLEEVKFWSKSAWWHFWKDSWLFWDLWKMDMWCHIFIKTQNDKNRKNPGISCWYSQGNLNLIWIQRHSKCSVGGEFSALVEVLSLGLLLLFYAQYNVPSNALLVSCKCAHVFLCLPKRKWYLEGNTWEHKIFQSEIYLFSYSLCQSWFFPLCCVCWWTGFSLTIQEQSP